MRIIKVPEGTVPVRHEDDEGKITLRDENFFWFVLKGIVRGRIALMSGLEVLQFEDLHKEIMAQAGKGTLKITRENEYEKLKEWVENFKGFPGKLEDVVANTTAMLRAFREAQKENKTTNHS